MTFLIDKGVSRIRSDRSGGRSDVQSFGKSSSWVCDECGKKLPTEHGLKTHRGRMHKTPSGKMPSRPLGVNVDRDGPAMTPIRGAVVTGQYRKWTDEEMRVLARLDYQMRHERGCKTAEVVKAAQWYGLDRTKVAIESKLRCPNYLAVRKGVWESLSSSGEPANEGSSLGQEGLDTVGKGRSEAESQANILSMMVTALRSGKQKFSVEYMEELLDSLVLDAQNGKPVEDVKVGVNEYFAELSARFKPKKKAHGESRWLSRNRKLQRAWELFRTQDHWQANRSRTARDILNGRSGAGIKPSDIPGFFDHWVKTFDPPVGPVSTENMVPLGKEFDIWNPMDREEIKESLQAMEAGKAAGPDGITVTMLKSLPGRVLVKWFNLFLFCGSVPEQLKQSTTVFIPKKETPQSASDFRPISMSSVILRLFNKILAKRLLAVVDFDYRQKAFLPIDGCAENIVLLEAILKQSSLKKRSLFLAMLDMKNAYGSVAHEAVVRALELKGADKRTVAYVRDLYTDYKTTLTSRGEEVPVSVRRGILQGDSLSPVLFNMVIDQLLNVIPEEVGFPLDPTTRVNGMAFADDLNVCSQTAAGMQQTLHSIEQMAGPLGLEFNANKCSMLASVAKKGKGCMRMIADTGFKFKIGGGEIPCHADGDSFRYLGAYFSSRGMRNAEDQLDIWLSRLKAAALMPSQKLYVLRIHLIPKLVHLLTFSEVNQKRLAKLDLRIRKFLHGFGGLLRLPRGTPSDYLYAPVADGGLGLQCLSRSIPATILRRFERLRENKDKAVEVAANMETNLRRIRDAVGALTNFEDILGEDRESIQVMNRNFLYDKVDGSGLVMAGKVSYVHSWVASGGVELLGNRQFIEAIKLRINALPTRSRRFRGTARYRQCRAGCNYPESNEHIMQRCSRTKSHRRERHNRVVEVLADELRARDFTQVDAGPTMRAGAVWYPDLIAVKEDTAYVVDARIIGDNVSEREAYESKVGKYRDIPGMAKHIKTRYAVERVKFGAAILTRRGLVGPRTDRFCRKVLGLPNSSMCKAALECIRGSLRIYHGFMKRGV